MPGISQGLKRKPSSPNPPPPAHSHPLLGSAQYFCVPGADLGWEGWHRKALLLFPRGSHFQDPIPASTQLTQASSLPLPFLSSWLRAQLETLGSDALQTADTSYLDAFKPKTRSDIKPHLPLQPGLHSHQPREGLGENKNISGGIHIIPTQDSGPCNRGSLSCECVLEFLCLFVICLHTESSMYNTVWYGFNGHFTKTAFLRWSLSIRFARGFPELLAAACSPRKDQHLLTPGLCVWPRNPFPSIPQHDHFGDNVP